MARTKKAIDVVNNVDAVEIVAEKATPVLKTFKVRRVVEYTMTAGNEYHAENKANKIAKDPAYITENPVEGLTVTTTIVETL